MYKKVLVTIISLLVLLSTALPYPKDIAVAASSLALTESLAVDESNSGYDVHYNGWSWNESFMNTNKKTVTRGIGFEPYYSDTRRMYAEFKISDYKYTTFETTISLDNKWLVGDPGKTQFTIFADNKKIYTQTFTNKTAAKKLKLAIPSGTQSLTLEVVMDKGTQGNHGAIFESPTLTNSLKKSSSYDALSLASIGTSEESNSGYDVYYGSWGKSPFELANGSLVGRGYGFEPYYSDTNRMWAKFKISDYSYTTLETEISLDNKWRTGDRGKTQVIIYADDKEIYSKTFENATSVEKVKAAIPSGTTWLTLEVVMDKGSQGSHGLIFGSPILTNSLANIESNDSVALATLGTSDKSSGNDVYYGAWNGKAFQMTDGTLVGRGYAFEPYYSDTKTMWAKYYIADYNYKNLITNVSPENKWRTGDRGTSSVFIFADEALIYEKEFTNNTDLVHLNLPIPKGTTYLTLQVNVAKGETSNHGIIFSNPILTIEDKIAPNAPRVNAISEKSTSIIGKAEVAELLALQRAPR